MGTTVTIHGAHVLLSSRLTLIGLKLPMTVPGDDLVKLVLESISRENIVLEEGYVLVLTQKIVSKAYGLLVDIRDVESSKKALSIAGRTGLDPRVVELILRESDSIVVALPFREIVERKIIDLSRYTKDYDRALKALEYYLTILITSREGMLWSESGIDTSNHPMNIYSIPSRDIDGIAKKISLEIMESTGIRVAVILCDTELFPWGAMEVARGSHGIEALTRGFGEPDMYGKPKFGGIVNIVFEICCAAGLIMGRAGEGIPAVLIKGLRYEWFDGGLGDRLIGIDQLKHALKLMIKNTRKVLGLRKTIKMFIKYLF